MWFPHIRDCSHRKVAGNTSLNSWIEEKAEESLLPSCNMFCTLLVFILKFAVHSSADCLLCLGGEGSDVLLLKHAASHAYSWVPAA